LPTQFPPLLILLLPTLPLLLHLPPLAVLVLVLEMMALLLVETILAHKVWGLMMAPVRETQPAGMKVPVQVMMLECMTVVGS
jgi:hypothetical protein